MTRPNGFQGIFLESIIYNFSANDTFRVEFYWNSDAASPMLGVAGLALADIGTDSPIGGGNYAAANWSRAIEVKTFAPDPGP